MRPGGTPNLKKRILNIATLVVVGGALGAAVAFMGCSRTAQQCNVSPIDIEGSARGYP